MSPPTAAAPTASAPPAAQKTAEESTPHDDEDDKVWFAFFKVLLYFFDMNGHLDFSKAKPQGRFEKLDRWLLLQRQTLRKGHLGNERKKLLDDMYADWHVDDRSATTGESATASESQAASIPAQASKKDGGSADEVVKIVEAADTGYSNSQIPSAKAKESEKEGSDVALKSVREDPDACKKAVPDPPIELYAMNAFESQVLFTGGKDSEGSGAVKPASIINKSATATHKYKAASMSANMMSEAAPPNSDNKAASAAPKKNQEETHWKEKYEGLRFFFLVNSHFNISSCNSDSENTTSHNELERWLFVQRQKLKEGQLLPFRKALLDNIHPNWYFDEPMGPQFKKQDAPSGARKVTPKQDAPSTPALEKNSEFEAAGAAAMEKRSSITLKTSDYNKKAVAVAAAVTPTKGTSHLQQYDFSMKNSGFKAAAKENSAAMQRTLENSNIKAAPARPEDRASYKQVAAPSIPKEITIPNQQTFQWDKTSQPVVNSGVRWVGNSDSTTRTQAFAKRDDSSKVSYQHATSHLVFNADIKHAPFVGNSQTTTQGAAQLGGASMYFGRNATPPMNVHTAPIHTPVLPFAGHPGMLASNTLNFHAPWMQNYRNHLGPPNFHRTNNDHCSTLPEDYETSDWTHKFRDLKNFFAVHGHLHIPSGTGHGEYIGLQSWLTHQRQLYRQGSVLFDREVLLRTICEDWHVGPEDPQGQSTAAAAGQNKAEDALRQEASHDADVTVKKHSLWMEKYVGLKQFYQENGHCAVPYTRKDLRGLYFWIEQQRKEFKKGPERLTEEQKRLLEDLSFDWAETKRKRRERDPPGQVAASQRESDRVPSEENDVPKVQRKCDDDAIKSPDSSAEVEVEGTADYDSLDDFDETHLLDEIKESPFGELWFKNFNKLKQFHRDHGHFEVPVATDKALSKYVWDQRNRLTKKTDSLAASKMLLLNEIGFDWVGGSNNNRTTRTEEVSPFPLKKPHMTNLSAGTQDQESSDGDHNKSAPSSEEDYHQPTQVSPVGGSMDGESCDDPVDDAVIKDSRYGEQWLKNYGKLKAYFARNGHFNVSYSEDQQLYKWIWSLNYKLAKKDCKDDVVRAKVNQLKRINFFDDGAAGHQSAVGRKVEAMPSKNASSNREDSVGSNDLDSTDSKKVGLQHADKAWMSRYNELREFFNKHGNFAVSWSGEYSNLYYWVRRQRKNRYAMAKSRRVLLDRIDFEWESGRSSARESRSRHGISDADATRHDDDLGSIDSKKVGATKSDRAWMAKFNALQLYFHKHGDFNVPRDRYSSLFRWIWRQRNRHDAMERNRRKLLDSIGFEWTALRDTNDEDESKFDEDSSSEGEDTDSSESESDDDIFEGAYNARSRGIDDDGRIEVPLAQVESMETYLEMARIQLKDKRQEVSELQEVASRIRRLLDETDQQPRTKRAKHT